VEAKTIEKQRHEKNQKLQGIRNKKGQHRTLQAGKRDRNTVGTETEKTISATNNRSRSNQTRTETGEEN
jgi:hypothetical protein